MTSLAAVRDILARLVAFDTTSRGTNLHMVEWVEDFLRPLGVELVRVPNADGDKAALGGFFALPPPFRASIHSGGIAMLAGAVDPGCWEWPTW